MNTRYSRLTTLALVAALCISGCAGMTTATRAPLADDVKRSLGTVAVLMANAETTTRFDTPPGKIGGMLGGAAAGAAAGSGVGVYLPPLFWVFTAVGVIGGTVEGFNEGVGWEQSQEADEAVELLKGIAADLNPRTTLSQRLRQQVKTRANQHPAEPDNGPSIYEEQSADYTRFSSKGIDTVLEMSAMQIALLGAGRNETTRLVNHPRNLEIIVRTRLIRTTNQEVIDERNVGFRSPTSHDFMDWSSDGASLFRKELDAALTSLTDAVVDDLLPVTGN